VADEDWLLFSFHLLQLHHFLPYYQEDGRDPVTLVEGVIKRAMMDAELPPGDPRVHRRHGDRRDHPDRPEQGLWPSWRRRPLRPRSPDDRGRPGRALAR
jgi:hypothetical protein